MSGMCVMCPNLCLPMSVLCAECYRCVFPRSLYVDSPPHWSWQRVAEPALA